MTCIKQFDCSKLFLLPSLDFQIIKFLLISHFPKTSDLKSWKKTQNEINIASQILIPVMWAEKSNISVN